MSESSLRNAAFRVIYEAHVGYVIATLRRLGVRESELEDVAHDLFVAVFRHLPEYDPDRPIRPWLFGFAIRMARDHRRLARHRVEQGDADAQDPAPQPDMQLEEERSRALCLRTLEALDFEKRAILVMLEFEDYSAQQIADHFAIPLNTAYSRIRLARAEFERHIRKTGVSS
jgi:RNA polymerase sigma-70 factor, ECF subfamily